ncbi:cell division protein FtsQ/DivIB [Agrilactobacillus yilanensis]|uniref:Cell division protein DivIB n=1 Tax=Agrilactobacillus yilanensis TaxID=2485997 RepID=A0ABW4J6C1_9LACO|nr:cell division protein FtsQ/DivIB [Agrilactobacillus yilanensis]
MAFFRKKQARAQKQVQKEPTEIIKPWRRYLDKKDQASETIRPARPVGEVLPKLKATRKRHLKRNLIIVLVPLCLLLIFVAYYVSPISKVGNVSVQGTEVIADQTIIDHSGVQKNDHILKLLRQKKKISAAILAGVPGLKTAELNISNFNQLTFNVTEYRQIGYLNKKNHYYSVLSNGTILKDVVAKPVGNLPVLEGFTEGKKLNFLIKTFKNLPLSIQNDISEIHLTHSKINPYQVRIYMNDENEVIADLRTIQKKLPNYPIYAKALKQKGVIDIEVGVFAYPFSKDTKK